MSETQQIKLDKERPIGRVHSGGPVQDNSAYYFQAGHDGKTPGRYFNAKGEYIPGMDVPPPPQTARELLPLDPKDIEIYELKKRMAKMESMLTGAPEEEIPNPQKYVSVVKNFDPATFDFHTWAQTNEPKVPWFQISAAIGRKYGAGRRPINREQAVAMIHGKLEALPGSN